METNPFKISKSNSTTSLPVEHSVLKRYPTLSRCNSFSSTSSDSAVYCGSQKILKNGKRSACENESAGSSKRRRNSSGSSVSSNMSCVSDKDLKSLCESPSKSLINNHSVENGDSSLNLVNGGELQNNNDSSQVNALPMPEDSVMLPSQRILRRQITKKGCTCCPSTRTTVVVRRYQEIFKTSKKKTVISSTKVKTYVQESSISNAVASNEERKKPKSGASRKRRSEVEKLYESLHEIEWAKNFSPDNILQQINIRQAASCSVFGRCHTKSETLHEKKSKRQKSTDSCNEFPFKSPSSKNGVIYPKTISKQNTSSENELHSDTKIKASESESKQISNSSTFLHEPNYNSCNSQSSVNITCSLSHINVKEINLKSTESVHAQSLLTINGTDFNDDAELSYTSDESSSAISSSIVNLQSKHQLDLDYKNRTNKGSSDVDVSELSATPTFIDIAEEGIRTIDACFREVGAEVVVSTCYEDNSLPSLQSADENTSKKHLSDDDPPILEPYVSATPKPDSIDASKDKSSFIVSSTVNRKSETVQKFSSNAQQSINSISKSFISKKSYAKFNTDTLNKCYSYFVYKNNRDTLLLKAGRKILNKYLKFLYSRTEPKVTIKFFSEEITSNDELSEESDNDSNSKQIKSTNSEHSDNINNRLEKSDDHFSEQFNIHGNSSEQSAYENHHSLSSDSDSENESGFPDTKESEILYNNFRRPAFPYSMPVRAPQTASNVSCQVFNNELNNKKYSTDNLRKNIFDASKSSSFVFNSVSTLKHKSKVKTYITSKVQSVSQQNIISSFIPTEVEGSNEVEEPVCRPISSTGSSSYHTIRVVRCTTYSQVTLKLTRGRSIFLTVQALRELSDAITRIGNDTSCKILILNGIGDAFCLGVDLKALVGPRKNITTTEMAIAVKDCIEALSHFKKPLAAVVNGPAIGLGMTLLNHADFTIASDTATFCMPNVFLGYMPEGGATLTLPQVVGSTVAMDLLLRGTQLSAQQALNIGLVSEVVKSQCLPVELVSRVKKFAGGSLSALETTKSILKMQLHVNLPLVLENEVKLLPRMWLTRTCQDAMRKALCSGILSE